MNESAPRNIRIQKEIRKIHNETATRFHHRGAMIIIHRPVIFRRRHHLVFLALVARTLMVHKQRWSALHHINWMKYYLHSAYSLAFSNLREIVRIGESSDEELFRPNGIAGNERRSGHSPQSPCSLAFLTGEIATEKDSAVEWRIRGRHNGSPRFDWTVREVLLDGPLTYSFALIDESLFNTAHNTENRRFCLISFYHNDLYLEVHYLSHPLWCISAFHALFRLPCRCESTSNIKGLLWSHWAVTHCWSFAMNTPITLLRLFGQLASELPIHFFPSFPGIVPCE